MSRERSDSARNMDGSARVEFVFATPVFSCALADVEALNAELRELILARERSVPSITKSNQGGWQSAADFFDWGGAAVATLERHAAEALRLATVRVPIPEHYAVEFELYGWAAVNRKGHYNTTHMHPMSTWSGVYYVDAGDEAAEAGGALLEFAHPIPAAVMTFFPGILPSARLVRPQTGMLILFPSYLQHSVRAYQGNRPRICVAFNAHMLGMG